MADEQSGPGVDGGEVQILKCTACEHEVPMLAAPEPLEGTEGRGTKTPCPKCGGKMEVQI